MEEKNKKYHAKFIIEERKRHLILYIFEMPSMSIVYSTTNTRARMSLFSQKIQLKLSMAYGQIAKVMSKFNTIGLSLLFL